MLINVVLQSCARVLVKLSVAAIVALIICVSNPTSHVFAKKGVASYGTLRLRTLPGGMPFQLDGKEFGLTTLDDRSFDVEPGVHIVAVTLPDGQVWMREINVAAGRVKCVSLRYRPAPPVAKLVCPSVNISAPAQVSEGEIINYTAVVTYEGSSPLNYSWTFSPSNAKALNGIGKPNIAVDSTGLAGQRVTAVLVVDDLSGKQVCRQVATASTFVPAPSPRRNTAKEFDVCRSCTFDDQKARLDNLAVELQNDPTTTAYVIAYGGTTSKNRQADRIGARAKDYLVNQRGIDATRVVVVNGGLSDEDSLALWIVPRGADPPITQLGVVIK